MQTHRSSRLTGPNTRTRAWGRKNVNTPRPESFAPLEAAGSDDATFRADLVARVRRQIADGTYGTEEQFEVAVERLLRHLDEMG